MKNSIFAIFALLLIVGCKDNSKTNPEVTVQNETEKVTKYPSDVLPFMDKWKILLGDGTYVDDLVNYQKGEFFYVENDGKTDWVVHKTPNVGVT